MRLNSRSAVPILAGLLVATAAVAQDAPQWISATDTVRIASAAFGVPETDDVRFALTCEGRRTVTVDPYLLLDYPGEVTPALRFVVDGREFIRGARWESRNEMLAGYPVVAVVARDDELIEALRLGNTLVSSPHPPSIRDIEARVTLTGSSDAIAAMLENC